MFRFLSNTLWISLVVAGLFTTMAGPLQAAQVTAEAGVEVAPEEARLGEVRRDTVFVNQQKIIQAALARNEMLAASGAMHEAAKAEALGAWRGFLPQIQVGEFFMRSDDALMSFGFKLNNRAVTAADFNPALLNNPGETNNYITRLQLRQPLFNGGMGLYGKQAANAMSRAAEYQHVRATETVRYQAIQAYEGLALAQAYGRVMTSAVASAEGHVRQAQSMVENDMATMADQLQAQVYLAGLQQRHIEVRNMVAIATEHIKLLTAVDTPLPLSVDATVIPMSEAPRSPDLSLAGLGRRSDLLARQEETLAAGKMVGLARGAMLPHINLSVQKDYYSRTDLFGNDANSWTLGVYATWDIFKGLENIGEIKKAHARERAAKHMYGFELRQAQVQATEAWLTAQAAREKVLVARQAVDAAREGLRIVTNQYHEGLASMVDLLDTQAAAIMAEGNLVQAVFDHRVGLANLEFAGAMAPVAADATANQTHPASAQD